MSLQSALEKAKELHGYFDDIKAGKFKEVYKAENGNYYKDEMYNNSVGVRVILGLNSNSVNCPRFYLDFEELRKDPEGIE